MKCPFCDNERLREHCPRSPACDLWRCVRCYSFGTDDGSRWARQRGVSA